MQRRDRGPVQKRRALLVAAVAQLWVVVPGNPVRAQQDDGLRFEAMSRYVVDTAAAAIHVSVDVTVENTTPDRPGRGGILQTFFRSLTIPVLAEATNVVATRSDGQTLEVEIEPTDQSFVSIAVIDLAPNLFFGQSQSLTFTYDLPDQPARSPRLTRVNPGFVYVLPIPLGDDGLASVEITVPDEYDVTAEGTSGTLERTTVDGNHVLRATAIAEPRVWNQAVVGRNDDALVSTTFEAGELEIEVRAWPGDVEWAEFVETQVSAGLPVLEKLIGQPPARQRLLRIVETVTPYIYGYAGWYQTESNVIEIGDELDARTIFHEISHVWFNGDVVIGRWVAEAFAEEYAARTIDRLPDDGSGPAPVPAPIDPAHPGALPLNEWSDPLRFDDLTELQEEYAYNASFAVLRAISDEIGIASLGRVTEAMLDRTIAYQGDGEAERWRGRTDWRRLLDLVQEVGGSATADDLFVTYVVTPNQAEDMAERGVARQALRQLEAAGDGWSPPLAVRQAMGRWTFDDAETLMRQAQDVLGIRTEVADTLEPLELAVPAAFESAYEGADDLDDLEDTAARFLGGSRAVADADEAVDEDDGIWGAIGLWGANPDGTVREAAARLADGDLDAAIELAEDAQAMIDDAVWQGQKRVAAVGAGLAVLAVGLMAWRVHRRRRAASADQLVVRDPQLAGLWGPEPAADSVEQFVGRGERGDEGAGEHPLVHPCGQLSGDDAGQPPSLDDLPSHLRPGEHPPEG